MKKPIRKNLFDKNDIVEERFNNETYINEMNKYVSFLEYGLKNSYILVEFPEVQEYMEKEWFPKEARLSDNSSYFIPYKRIKEMEDKNE